MSLVGCKTFRGGGGEGGGGDFIHLSRVSFPPSQADSLFCFFILFFLFACRMSSGYKEVFNSQAGRRRVTSLEMPIASNLVVAMSVEELRLYNKVPAEISLKMLDGLATSTVGEADNAVYFTREQFAAGLRFPVPSLVKAVFALYLGTSYARTSECFSDSNGL